MDLIRHCNGRIVAAKQDRYVYCRSNYHCFMPLLSLVSPRLSQLLKEHPRDGGVIYQESTSPSSWIITGWVLLKATNNGRGDYK